MNTNLVESFENDTHILDVETMDDPYDPRECGNISVMITFCKRNNIGDVYNLQISPKEFKIDMACRLDPIAQDNLTELLAMDQTKEIEKQIADIVHAVLYENTVMLPIYMLDHSGIRLSTSDFNDRWDSGYIGFIYVDKKNIPEYGIELENGEITENVRTKVKEILNQEVELYDSYVSGDCYIGILYEKDECYYCNGAGEKYINPNLGFEQCRACKGTKYLRREIAVSGTRYGYKMGMFREIAMDFEDYAEIELLKNMVEDN